MNLGGLGIPWSATASYRIPARKRNFRDVLQRGLARLGGISVWTHQFVKRTPATARRSRSSQSIFAVRVHARSYLIPMSLRSRSPLALKTILDALER